MSRIPPHKVAGIISDINPIHGDCFVAVPGGGDFYLPRCHFGGVKIHVRMPAVLLDKREGSPGLNSREPVTGPARMFGCVLRDGRTLAYVFVGVEPPQTPPARQAPLVRGFALGDF